MPPPTPPPLPAAPAPVSTQPEQPAQWRLWGALLVFIIAADVGLYETSAPAAGLVPAGLCAALGAAWVSRGEGRPALGFALTLSALLATLLEPSFSSVVVFFAGLCLLAWMNRAAGLAWGFSQAPLQLLAAVPRLLCEIPSLCGGVARAGRACNFNAAGRAFKLLAPAVLASALFLVLLSFGNAVLAQWVETAWGAFRELVMRIVFPPWARVLFWVWMLLLGGLLLMPALRRANKPAREGEGFLTRRWEWFASVEMQGRLVLAGVNIVFLLTNTLDAVYLWIRRAPPEGVNTTDYLYNGVYGLVFATLVAGGMLAALFNGGAPLARSRWLRGLGFAWVAQNVFLIAGAGMRCWLHVENYCLSPRRVGVGFFLALLLAGYGLLSVYMLRGKTLRWLVGRNLAAVVALFFITQFCDIQRWCADSAARRIKANPKALTLDARFLNSIGLAGWRVVETQAWGGAETSERTRAQLCRNEFLRTMGTESRPPRWQSWSWRENREMMELCKAVGFYQPDPRIPGVWRNAVKEHYPWRNE